MLCIKTELAIEYGALVKMHADSHSITETIHHLENDKINMVP